MSEKTLFFNTLPTDRTSPFSFPVRDERLLKHLTRDASVWIVGASSRMREELARLIRFLEVNAHSVKDSGLAVSPGADVSRFAKIARGVASQPGAMLLLAEEEYGPAFAALCGALPPFTPVILPSGFLAPSFPTARLEPTYPESAATPDIAGGLAALAGKRLLVWGGEKRYRYAVKPLFDRYCPTARILGLVTERREEWGGECCGIPILSPEALRAASNPPDAPDTPDTAEAVVAGVGGAARSLAALHTLASRPLPVLFVQQNPLLSHATFAYRATSEVPRFFRRMYYNPYLSKEKYAVLFKGDKAFSPEHYASVSTTGLPITLRRNTYEHADISGAYLNIQNGLRKTTDGIPDALHSIHLFGPSYAFCTLSDDADTIASHLQRFCNSEYPALRYAVYNHGVTANRLENIARQAENTPLAAGDVVLIMPPYAQYDGCLDILRHIHARCARRGARCAVFFQPSLLNVVRPSAYERLLVAEYKQLNGLLFDVPEETRRTFDPSAVCRALRDSGVPAFDLQPSVQRPYSGQGGDTDEEIFVDFIHTAGKGNARIARAMAAMFLKDALCGKDSEVPAVSAACGDESASGVGNIADRASLEFVEHVRDRFITHPEYIDWLASVPRFGGAAEKDGGKILGSIVMNCNPFTLGHRHIVQRALDACDFLYVFAVEENASVFSFQDRLAMIRQGLEDCGERLRVVPSGRFLLSSFTFPEYFCKDTVTYTPDASVEIALFAGLIAPGLNIGKRFFGEEPLCAVTRAYHAQLRRVLPLCGIKCVEIPRVAQGGAPISASRARLLLRERKLEELATLVPPTTLRHLLRLVRSAPPPANLSA